MQELQSRLGSRERWRGRDFSQVMQSSVALEPELLAAGAQRVPCCSSPVGCFSPSRARGCSPNQCVSAGCVSHRGVTAVGACLIHSFWKWFSVELVKNLLVYAASCVISLRKKALVSEGRLQLKRRGNWVWV